VPVAPVGPDSLAASVALMDSVFDVDEAMQLLRAVDPYYRVRGNHMIVDRLFAAAELRFGSGSSQRRVRIVRTDGRPAS
jgi:type IV secretory pathway VirB9-like protein